jgi:YidC/Oxa1 family membrane protein insertase
MQEPKKSSILAIPGVTQAGITTVCIALIIVMVLTSYYTQRQIMRRSGPVEGQAAMVQKLMLYGMPLGLLVSGSLFPIGVLLYWFTNNLWTLGQQFYILKKLPPPPGSPQALAAAAAEKAAIDPKALAPKPGAKPVRGKGGRPVLPPAAPEAPAATDADGEPATGSDGAASPASPTESDRSQGNGAAPNGSTAPQPGARPPGKPKRKRR